MSAVGYSPSGRLYNFEAKRFPDGKLVFRAPATYHKGTDVFRDEVKTIIDSISKRMTYVQGNSYR